MNNNSLLKTLSMAFVFLLTGNMNAQNEKMIDGPYEPTWESLSKYGQAPEWFRDAKFGIWAHWGPQCQPEAGDWYARDMYREGSNAYKYHLAKYGHPSEFGFKDVINEWKADKWNPERLMKLYKKAGAKYFVTLGNHHDNFDLWDSKYHNWNSVNLGPKKNIVDGWKKAADANGLRFGISIHSSHAWTWYEPSQGADTKGPKAGVRYDGRLTKADGKGKWWEGYDPQELYVQNHFRSQDNKLQWDWDKGSSVPTPEYFWNFYDRNLDVINKYNPDLIYYDDTGMALWPVSDVGLRVTAHLYNKSISEKGRNEAVVTAKILNTMQKNCIVWDVERGTVDNIQEKPWQTCTCIGSWHYKRSLYDKNQYKSAATVIRMLVDIISKNGNLLLSVPIRGDGTIDDKEEAILADIAAWMEVNQEAVFGTRPWKVFGEGPIAAKANPLKAQGFNENTGNKYSAADIRFVTKGTTLYAHVMAWPEEGVNEVLIKSLAADSTLYPREIKQITMLGHKKALKFSRTADGLRVMLPKGIRPNSISLVLKIEGGKLINNGKPLPLSGELGVHDPVMIKQDDTYYVFATGGGVSMKKSDDMLNWQNYGRVFEKDQLPAWHKADIPEQDGHLWAPDITYANGRYYMYYSVSAWMNFNSSIGLATNKTLDRNSPDYRWVDEGKVIDFRNGGDKVNVIDPNLFIDTDGKWWLVYGSYKAGLRLVRINPATGKLLNEANPEPVTLTTSLGEGAYIIKGNGYYYLVCSRGRCCAGMNSTYQMVMGRSKKIEGPYLTREGGSMLDNQYTVLLAGDKDEPGRGHNGFFTDDGITYIVYHAYTRSADGESLLNIRPLYVTPDGWLSVEAKGNKLFKRILP